MSDNLKKLTGKNRNEYETVAKHLVDDCDVELFKELVDNDDFLFDFVKNNVTIQVENLMSFVEYTITFYEKEKGLTLKKDKALATYKQTIYAREDFIGRAFKIKNVYFDQLIQGNFVRKKYSFNTTYIKFVNMINNDNFIIQLI